MLNHAPSNRKLKRLNRRQRKKLRVGEFQELVFRVMFIISQPASDTTKHDFLDPFLDLIESRDLEFSGVSSLLPLNRTNGTVAGSGRRSASDEDRKAVSA